MVTVYDVVKEYVAIEQKFKNITSELINIKRLENEGKIDHAEAIKRQIELMEIFIKAE